MEYFIHDNYNKPYKVIHKGSVEIYIKQNDNYKYFKTINPRRVFIGSSPLCDMTDFNGTTGERFYGNTILLHISDNEYMFIGNCGIFKFLSKSFIEEFYSPVGNNDVPYPWAIDIEKNTYLFTLDEKVIINSENYQKFNRKLTPYDFYYSYDSKKLNYYYYGDKIKDLLIGNDKFNFNYSLNPKENYERMLSYNKGKIAIQLENNKIIPITKEEYITIQNETISPFEKLKIDIIKEKV
jgi:hypothetical protein